MADEIDDLLAARASGGAKDEVDAELGRRSGLMATPAPEPTKVPQAEMPWYRRAAQGVMDPLVGAGQLAQHAMPESAANLMRSPASAAIAGMMPVASVARGFLNAASGGKQGVTTADVDAFVADREEKYQGERKAAGGDGLDWWRIGGNVSNPLSWVGPAKAAGILNGIRAGAQSGALQALMQPVATEGNFIWDKSVQGALGATVGGTLGGALQVLAPAFSAATRAAKSIVGASDEATQAAAATRITDDTLKAAGANPAKIDPNLYSAVKREVNESLRMGMDPDPSIMARHADAAALPVPVRLTRGQAARDPMQFAWEHRVAGQQGVGEPLSGLLSAQNRALIENLNQLGAGRALSPFDASRRIISQIEGVDSQLRTQINQAYAAVKDSAGRPARVDNQAFADLSKNLLTEGRPELAGLVNRGDFIPAKIRDVYNDIVTGKLPLTVDTVQFLDRNWGAVQRAAPDDEAMAIGTLRRALNQTPVDDLLGQESMAAYNAAKALAKQRFDLIEAIPAYKAIEIGSRKSEPDTFFRDFVSNANVSELKGLKQLIGAENVAMLQDTLVSNLKHKSLSGASDDNGVFSQAAYNKVLHDPTQAPRIRELFADNEATLGHLYRLGRVSEDIIKIPAASKVNTSNTASAGANVVRDVMKSETGQLASSMLPNWLSGLARTVGDAGRRVEESRAVSEAVRPAVTAQPLPTKIPERPSVRRLSDLVSRGSAGAAASDERDDGRKY